MRRGPWKSNRVHKNVCPVCVITHIYTCKNAYWHMLHCNKNTKAWEKPYCQISTEKLAPSSTILHMCNTNKINIKADNFDSWVHVSKCLPVIEKLCLLPLACFAPIYCGFSFLFVF